MLINSELLFSSQYLTLDLLESLCARAREVTRIAFEHGESLSDEELFNLIMIDMACKAEELQDLQSMFAEAGVATANVLDKVEAIRLEDSAVSSPLHSLPGLRYSPEGHWQNSDL